MKYAEIVKLDAPKLKDEISKLVSKLGELQHKKSISPGSIKDVSVFKKTRKLIAQLKFVLSSKK